MFNFYKFSTETTRLEAEKLAKEFLEFDNVEDVPILGQSSLKEPIENEDELPKANWIVINDESSSEEEEEESENDEQTATAAVPSESDCHVPTVENHPVAMEINDDVEMGNVKTIHDDKQIIDLERALEQSGGSSISPEIGATIALLSESDISKVLANLRNNNQALISFIASVLEFLNPKEQSSVLAILCSKVLLPKVLDKSLESNLLWSTCNIASLLPEVITSNLLLPILKNAIQEIQIVKSILTMTESENLCHSLLRCWPCRKFSTFTEEELDILKVLLKTIPKDGDTIMALSLTFKKLAVTLASDLSFSKLMLQSIKAFSKVTLQKGVKKNLELAINANKTPIKKLLEKSLANLSEA